MLSLRTGEAVCIGYPLMHGINRNRSMQTIGKQHAGTSADGPKAFS